MADKRQTRYLEGNPHAVARRAKERRRKAKQQDPALRQVSDIVAMMKHAKRTPEEMRPEIIRTIHDLKDHPDPGVQAVLHQLNKAVGGRVNLSKEQFK